MTDNSTTLNPEVYRDPNKQNGGDPFANSLENTQDWELAYLSQDSNSPGYIEDEELFRSTFYANQETFMTETPEEAGYIGIGRFATFNADGTVQGPGQLARPNGSDAGVDESQTVSSQELARANAQSGGASAYANDAQASQKRYVPASDVPWAEFYKDVSGRHNVLHDFNTYTYNLTLVSLSKQQVEDPSTYKGQVVSATGVESESFYIVAKSGGFARTGENQDFIGPMPVGQQTQFKRDRPNTDLFIENLTFDTRVGINDMGQSNLTTGTFEVTEPHGVGGFYRQLFASSKFSGHPNYIDSPFLLIINFIGRIADEQSAVIPENSTRYLPIRITNSEMSVDEGGARYTVSFMAYNSVGASDAVSVLWDQSNPRARAKESVESLLYSVFLFNTKEAEKLALKHQGEYEQDNEKVQAVQARRESNEVLNLARGQGLSESQIGIFLPHKYFVHFAPSWNGEFPTTASALGAKSSDWTNNARKFLDLKNDQPLPASSQPTNAFGSAMMSPEMLPNSNVIIDNYQKQLEEHEKEIDEKKDRVKAAQDIVRSELETFNALRESLTAQLKAAYGEPEKLEPSLSPDQTVGPTTKSEDVVENTTRQTQEAINAANGLLNPSQRDSRFPTRVNLPPSEISTIVTLRTKLEDAQKRINTASEALATSEQELKTAVESAKSTQGSSQPIGSGHPYAFRKGSSLLDVIDICITNSRQMQTLVSEVSLNQIERTEKIPWYRVDITSNIIGFDVVTMNYQYEYHYVISPYSIHYSKMPGVNIMFSTEKLREAAVREYNYIYTGKNIDVLNFDIKYNNLFRYPLLLSPPSENALQSTARTEVSNTTITESNFQQVTSRIENRINNKLGETGFTMANAIEPMDYLENPTDNGTHIGKALKDFLYAAPADQGLIRAQVEIVGDPVYIIGSGITDRPMVSTNDITTPDGEMNAFSREPDVIFNFRFPEDTPTSVELQNGTYQQQLMEGEYSGLYQVLGVENRFVDGTFTQGLTLLRRRNQKQDYEVNDRGQQINDQGVPVSVEGVT